VSCENIHVPSIWPLWLSTMKTFLLLTQHKHKCGAYCSVLGRNGDISLNFRSGAGLETRERESLFARKNTQHNKTVKILWAGCQKGHSPSCWPPMIYNVLYLTYVYRRNITQSQNIKVETIQTYKQTNKPTSSAVQCASIVCSQLRWKYYTLTAIITIQLEKQFIQ